MEEQHEIGAYVIEHGVESEENEQVAQLAC
jgi:hypothetical protein